MSRLSAINRRALMRMSVAATAAPMLGRLLGASAQAQDSGPGMHRVDETGGRDTAALFAGKDLPGGGQTEIRINQSIYTSDPHELRLPTAEDWAAKRLGAA